MLLCCPHNHVCFSTEVGKLQPAVDFYVACETMWSMHSKQSVETLLTNVLSVFKSCPTFLYLVHFQNKNASSLATSLLHFYSTSKQLLMIFYWN